MVLFSLLWLGFNNENLEENSSVIKNSPLVWQATTVCNPLCKLIKLPQIRNIFMTFRDGSSKVYLFCFTLDELFLAFVIARDLAPLQ